MADVRTPAARVESAQIRAWARDNGWPDLPDRGKLPVEVREAWEAATGPDGPDEGDEPDLSAMDESDLDDEELGHPVGVEPGLPPPADLDEARTRAGRQPASAHLIRGRKRGNREAKPDQPPVRITKAVRDDITGKVAFWLMIPSEPWLRVDPYCGQEYADSIDEIAVKMTPLLCRSPAVVRWFGKTTTFIEVTELMMACRPVAEAVIAHHVTKRIQLDAQGRVITDAAGQPVPAQNGGMDFSAYSARQPNPAAA